MERESKINNPQENNKDSVEFIRHSKSSYKTYGDILKSENPTSKLNLDEQERGDLTEEGVELARRQAEKFFEALSPETDALFFVSSGDARALETGNIYRQVAKEKKFEVIKPKHARSKYSEELSKGEIRVIDELSTNPENMLIDFLFVSPSKRGEINWDAVDSGFKSRFDEASKIIEADDQGSYGGNFAKHSEQIKAIFPEIKSAEDKFKTHFQNLKRLAKFGLKKVKGSDLEKNVKILAFGHEGYVVHAIQNLFQEEGINNCETIHITMEGDNLVGKFRGKEANL